MDKKQGENLLMGQNMFVCECNTKDSFMWKYKLKVDRVDKMAKRDKKGTKIKNVGIELQGTKGTKGTNMFLWECNTIDLSAL